MGIWFPQYLQNRAIRLDSGCAAGNSDTGVAGIGGVSMSVTVSGRETNKSGAVFGVNVDDSVGSGCIGNSCTASAVGSGSEVGVVSTGCGMVADLPGGVSHGGNSLPSKVSPVTAGESWKLGRG